MAFPIPFLESAPVIPDAANDRLASELLAVVTELSGVIADENDILSRGIPASVVETLDRKLALTEVYEELWERMDETGEGCGFSTESDLSRDLMDAVRHLRDVTSENLDRLEEAVDASKRRVDAVMAAMQEIERNTTTGYTADGDVLAVHFPRASAKFHC